jgi:hypothetical protein
MISMVSNQKINILEPQHRDNDQRNPNFVHRRLADLRHVVSPVVKRLKIVSLFKGE